MSKLNLDLLSGSDSCNFFKSQFLNASRLYIVMNFRSPSIILSRLLSWSTSIRNYTGQSSSRCGFIRSLSAFIKTSLTSYDVASARKTKLLNDSYHLVCSRFCPDSSTRTDNLMSYITWYTTFAHFLMRNVRWSLEADVDDNEDTRAVRWFLPVLQLARWSVSGSQCSSTRSVT